MTMRTSRFSTVGILCACLAIFLVAPSAFAQGVVFVKANNMGVGDFSSTNPTQKVHVKSSGDAQILVEDNAGTTGVRAQFEARNNGANLFRFRNTATGDVWFFGGGSADSLIIEKNASGGGKLQVFADGTTRIGPKPAVVFDLTPSGNLTIDGTLTQGSSRTTKWRFGDVDAETILDRVDELPLSEWTYRADKSGARHIGPMAEDFRAAFGLGADTAHLAPADTAGVALAAIQGLNQRLERKELRIEELEAQLEDVAAQLAEIHALLDQQQ